MSCGECRGTKLLGGMAGPAAGEPRRAHAPCSGLPASRACVAPKPVQPTHQLQLGVRAVEMQECCGRAGGGARGRP